MEVKSKREVKWYALRVITGKERKTKETLEREIKMQNLEKYVKSILLPTEKEYKLRNGKKFSREKVVFPGYLYFEASLIGELPRIVKRTNGVINFVNDGSGAPAAIPQRDIDRIVGNVIKAKEGPAPYVVGESINIIDGPFLNFKASVILVDEVKERVEVNVLIFGRETPVELKFLQIEKV